MKMMLVKVIYRELVLQIQEAFVPLSSTSYHRHRRRQNSLITSVDFSEYPLRDHNVLAVAVPRAKITRRDLSLPRRTRCLICTSCNVHLQY
ncbi:PREDICTED: uncharacterized protein LOC106744277 isoform X2 [Dinoponera quadriceps]|uniref:Uncharacterized protein LOC106744277 isoform X2 n=1 Tax=Dinoponera quadriceps TaxID=609295 RepID=A0A6P3X961_DINQU|nr:PREDICTED: uncharacterized protein LOC106744277 isoform X2 [Dinoponera quadriceps]